MKFHGTRWFRLLCYRAEVIARLRKVAYPNPDPRINAEINREAETQLGAGLRKRVRREMGWQNVDK